MEPLYYVFFILCILGSSLSSFLIGYWRGYRTGFHNGYYTALDEQGVASFVNRRKS